MMEDFVEKNIKKDININSLKLFQNIFVVSIAPFKPDSQKMCYGAT